MKIQKKRYLSKKEIIYLRENCYKLGVIILAKKLGRSRLTIYNHMKKFKEETIYDRQREVRKSKIT